MLDDKNDDFFNHVKRVYPRSKNIITLQFFGPLNVNNSSPLFFTNRRIRANQTQYRSKAKAAKSSDLYA